jgi:heme a synthase
LNSTAIREFRKLCFTTLIAVYVLILVGGIVRSSGSGMGCPDWPKCFGSWIPPTSVNQLPKNYKEINAAFREKKNNKFARYLRAVGFNTTADQLQNDQSVLAETDFNLTKTWIEYLNRLVGVVIGLLIIGLFWKSVKLRKQHHSIFIFSLATLVAVIVQGWFGSIVVSTNLTAWTVTVHMFLALLIVGFLIYLFYLTDELDPLQAPLGLKNLLVVCMGVLLVQVFFGTQVREAIDRIASAGFPRADWISELGVEFIFHRSFSWLVVILHVSLVAYWRKTTSNNVLSLALIFLILCTFMTGAMMAYVGVQAMVQPLHLVMATGAFGLQLLLFFRLKSTRTV